MTRIRTSVHRPASSGPGPELGRACSDGSGRPAHADKGEPPSCVFTQPWGCAHVLYPGAAYINDSGRLEQPAVTERNRPLGLPSQVQHSDGVLLLKQRMLCNHLLFHFQYSSGILKRHLRLVWFLHYYTPCVSTLGLLAFQTDSRNPNQVRGTGHTSSGAHEAVSLSW